MYNNVSLSFHGHAVHRLSRVWLNNEVTTRYECNVLAFILSFALFPNERAPPRTKALIRTGRHVRVRKR
jgi:hypothetical protein